MAGIAAVGLIALAACGAGTEIGAIPTTAGPDAANGVTEPHSISEPVPLVAIAETGGCYMMGPNCATILVMSDGSFGVFRNDPAAVLAVPDTVVGADYTGFGDVSDLAAVIAATDFISLKDELPPGECRACFDGIDYEVRFFTASGVEDLASVEHGFDDSLVLFAELAKVIRTADDAGQLKVMARGS
jgi:hypothetical protein